MYGGIWAIPKGKFNELSEWLQNHLIEAKHKYNPLSDEFSFTYFDNLFNSVGNNESVKAALATKGRIPGLGNGVLHDILYYAKINPKRKVYTLTIDDKMALFTAIKEILDKMVQANGRCVEKDIFNHKGGFKVLSTFCNCPRCNEPITKEQYMGGSIYYCKTCQK